MEQPGRGKDDRVKRGEEFVKQIFRKLHKLGFLVAINGTEYTHPKFIEHLRLSTDQTSLAIRFEPDGVIAWGEPPMTWYVEAKASDKIEKTAYEQYMKRQREGNVLIVVFQHRDIIYWQFIEQVEFINSNEYVNHYANPFPVIDGWIYPRRSQYWHDIKWDNPQASGTAYQVVDMTSLRPWHTIKQVFMEQLTREITHAPPLVPPV